MRYQNFHLHFLVGFLVNFEIFQFRSSMYVCMYFSYIVAVSFIDGGNRSTRRKPPTCSKSLANFTTYCCIEYTSLWAGFKLATLVVIAIGHCKYNYHVIIATTAPNCFCLRGKIQPLIENQWTFSLDYDI